MNYSECRVSQVLLLLLTHLLLWKILNYPLDYQAAAAALIILDALDKTPEYKFTD